MFEDEDVSDGEGWRHLQLTWRADGVTKFFYELDERSQKNKKEYVSERTKRVKTGESTLRPPKNAPVWAIKQRAETPLPTNPVRGRGLRTRGGRKSTDSRSSANTESDRPMNSRRGINFSRDNVLNNVLH